MNGNLTGAPCPFSSLKLGEAKGEVINVHARNTDKGRKKYRICDNSRYPSMVWEHTLYQFVGMGWEHYVDQCSMDTVFKWSWLTVSTGNFVVHHWA